MTAAKLAEYAKFLVALATAAVVSAETFVVPGSTWGHVLVVVTAVLGAAGVLQVKNADQAPPTQ